MKLYNIGQGFIAEMCDGHSVEKDGEGREREIKKGREREIKSRRESGREREIKEGREIEGVKDWEREGDQ